MLSSALIEGCTSSSTGKSCFAPSTFSFLLTFWCRDSSANPSGFISFRAPTRRSRHGAAPG
uniref:Uncharacterized protein LOC8265046 isoform X3 n=1 Tax=Rhizophora mucronata TaxID=61149 RepID=A0A2P2LXN0_RHIMU